MIGKTITIVLKNGYKYHATVYDVNQTGISASYSCQNVRTKKWEHASDRGLFTWEGILTIRIWKSGF